MKVVTGMSRGKCQLPLFAVWILTTVYRAAIFLPLVDGITVNWQISLIEQKLIIRLRAVWKGERENEKSSKSREEFAEILIGCLFSDFLLPTLPLFAFICFYFFIFLGREWNALKLKQKILKPIWGFISAFIKKWIKKW